ncbi:hypothetical protein CBL_10390 [Carabus blaptoides fortunei]
MSATTPGTHVEASLVHIGSYEHASPRRRSATRFFYHDSAATPPDAGRHTPTPLAQVPCLFITAVFVGSSRRRVVQECSAMSFVYYRVDDAPLLVSVVNSASRHVSGLGQCIVPHEPDVIRRSFALSLLHKHGQQVSSP